MIQLRDILCPVDLSPISRQALDHAVAIAHRYAARLSLLHVRDAALPAALPLAFSPSPHGGVAAAPASDTTARLRDLVQPALASGIAAETIEDEGDPAVCIIERANLADLVVMATHGRVGLKRLVLGSVTSRVLHASQCPILTVPPPCHEPPTAYFSRIVCAVDFSDVSLHALEYALSLALEMRAGLTLLHVAETELADDLGGDRPFAAADEALARLRQLHRRLAALVPEQARGRAEPETQVREGRPAGVILASAADLDANLIVMGARGRRRVGAWLGSTADHVIQHAGCPVLTVGHRRAHRMH